MFKKSKYIPVGLIVAIGLGANGVDGLHLPSQPRKVDTLSRLGQTVINRPTHVDIEKAAGQREAQVSPDLATIQGRKTEPPAECKCYTNCPLLADSPEIRDRLFKLTKPRDYPLFVAEKAAKYLVDDIWNPPKHAEKDVLVHFGKLDGQQGQRPTKEKLVVLGAGWGSAAFLRGIDTDRYDVTIISPRNYFLFTPMLAGASVGTIDVRSITQPIREFNPDANYLEAAAKDIDPEKRTVKCSGLARDAGDQISEFEVPYDRLIVAVGARINTFGIPGIQENCSYLKEVNHARKIRRSVVSLFEQANLPGTSDEKKEKLLTFAIIGAGPTGVEFAGELRDFVEQEGPKHYKSLLKHVRIKLIEATPVVLRPFDKSLQNAAVDALTQKPSGNGLFADSITELVINKKVNEVTKDTIKLEDGKEIPYGLAVWAGGIGPLRVTLDLIERIGGRQKINQNVARGKLAVDPWLRVIDGGGRIFAVGDCACNQGGPLPATAQVAAQQGEFLAHSLNVGNHTIDFENGVQLPPKKIPGKTKLLDSVATIATGEKEYLAPFQYLDLGILAYTGKYSALAQLQLTPNDADRIKTTGMIGFGLWRSIYLAKQTSVRNQMLVFFNWAKTQMFGRDITLID